MSRTLAFIKSLSQSSKLDKKASKSAEKDADKTSKRHRKGIPFILGTEFVERFSFYCFQGILTLYLTQELEFSDHVATSIFHAFMVLAYITPLPGAIIADAWLGLFRTILYISIIYAIGNFIVSIGATPLPLQSMTITSLTGLFIVALGTGGIKPCVSAFGGNQFEKNQTKEIRQFFSYYFFAINLGSILSTVISPELRATVHCFGKRTCYPLAFGFPALLSVIAITLFVCGKHMYKIKPAEGKEIIDVFNCIFYALKQKFKNKGKVKKDHWLEYADDKYDKKLIFDIKSFLQVTWMYIPLPIYWALYEQQGSTWILQSAAMDGQIGNYHIKPDQMQIFNPILILTFIPLFDSVLYPLLMKCGLCKKPLQRMATGGILVGIAFLMAGFIQLEIEKELPANPPAGISELAIINNSPCKLELKGAKNFTMLAYKSETLSNLPSNNDTKWEVIPLNCSATNSSYTKFRLSAPFMSMMVALSNDTIDIQVGEDTKIKEKNGNPRIRMHFSTDYVFTDNGNASILFVGPEKYFVYPDNITPPSGVGSTEYCVVQPGLYKIYLPINESAHQKHPVGEVHFRDGGSYLVGIYQNSVQKISAVSLFMTVHFNSVHMLYQLPQIIVLTAGEIMFEVTGLDFSYGESPASLKSVVQGFWYFTNGFGNACYIFIEAVSTTEKQSHTFFMYVCIMAISMAVFCILAHHFIYARDRLGKKQAVCL